MLWKAIILSTILVVQAFSIESEYYELSKLQRDDVFFPKSDTVYVDELISSSFSDRDYRLAEAYYKLGEEEKASEYIKTYEKNGDALKLIKYYQRAKDYEKVDSLLEKFLEEQDEESVMKYKILIEERIESESLTSALDIEKYRVDPIEKLFYYRTDDEKFKDYFNKNTWQRKDINKLLDKFINIELKQGSKAQELFEMVATDTQKMEKKYRSIEDLSDLGGYEDYFRYVYELEVKPILKDEIEALYYLDYVGREAEVESIFNSLLEKYKEMDDVSRIKTLYRWKPRVEEELYLKERDEEIAYEYLRNNLDSEMLVSEAEEFLVKFPKGERAERVYTMLFNMGSAERKEELIGKHPNDYKVTRDYRYAKLSDEEKLAYQRSVIEKGNLENSSEYVTLLEGRGNADVAKELEELNLELYFEYQNQNNQEIASIYEKEYIDYLVEKGDYIELDSYREKLSKEQLKQVSRDDFVYKSYYKERYPLEEENLDKEDIKYFFFNKNLPQEKIRIEELMSLENPNPQEIYYLARYHYENENYVSSYREIQKIYKKYKLSDEIYNLYLKNIEKITDKETN